MLEVGGWREDNGFMIAMKGWFNLKEISAKALVEGTAAHLHVTHCLDAHYIYLMGNLDLI